MEEKSGKAVSQQESKITIKFSSTDEKSFRDIFDKIIEIHMDNTMNNTNDFLETQ